MTTTSAGPTDCLSKAVVDGYSRSSNNRLESLRPTRSSRRSGVSVAQGRSSRSGDRAGSRAASAKATSKARSASETLRELGVIPENDFTHSADDSTVVSLPRRTSHQPGRAID